MSSATAEPGVVQALGAADLQALAEAAQIPLAEYRAPHVAERVRRALQRERLAGPDDLVALLRRDAGARSRFRRAVAVSVSGFFRDSHQFDLLAAELLPPLLAARERLRVWSAGCAEGQELYSLGIVLARAGRLADAYLLGSDLLAENLAVARTGAPAVPEVDDALRARVRWEERDLVAEPPPSGAWDLVLCRNVAIYLAPAARDALHARLASALAPGGILLLGRSERIANAGALRLQPAGPHAYRRPE